jgi:hypothetical protein
VEFVIALDQGRVLSRRLTNRLVNETLQLPAELFSLEFEGGYKATSASLTAAVTRTTGSEVEVLFSGEGLQVRVRYELPAGKPYLRKQVSVRRTDGEPRRLLGADLDNWQGVHRNWKSMSADRLKYGSHPVFCETWWAGVEFVAAFNEYDGNGFVLRSRPGGRLVGSGWVALHPTVTGVAESNAVREAFLSYIEDIRLAPPKLVACYNSWWTLPKVVAQRDNLALIRELKTALYDRHGVFFDIITTDMGWSNPRSIWEIDRSILPAGFDDIRAVVEPAGGKLGLWMSPSETYSEVCDYDWAGKNGYVVIQNWRGRRGLSLADPRYRAETKAALKKLIRENGLGHIKYDGFAAEEYRPHHGLLPGKDSVEPLAACSIELLEASKQENANLVTEPTYMNSYASYISPWIIKYSDTVWGNAGGDCPRGIGPAPEYRESATNAREFYIFSSLDEFWLPQNAVHYFDIVHVDSREGFANHAAMAFGRGRFFVSTYLNPKLMSEEDWRTYAGLLRWARANRDILRNTIVLRSRVELGEPYIYAHWLGRRGILAVRNPSNEGRRFGIDLKKAGAPRGLADAVCYTQYPYRKGIATGLTGASQLELELAPWELLFLEILPRSELKETIAIGARWYRQSDEATVVVPDWDMERVRLLQPGRGERVVPVNARRRGDLRGKLISEAVRPVPESQWLRFAPERSTVFPFHYPAEPESGTIRKLEEVESAKAKEQTVPTVAFEVECSVSAPPDASRARVLLLLQFPGREYRPSRCNALIDGLPARIEESNSSQREGNYAASANNPWKAILPYESHWCWYICEFAGGARRVKFSGTAGHPKPRIGLWAWTEYNLNALKVPVPLSCGDPAMPQYRPEIEHHGICLKAAG